MKYVLITPAHNEEAFIEKTLASVILQTLLPERWVLDALSPPRRAEKTESHLESPLEIQKGGIAFS
jgi:glycosyltransferase involved in cell wall biosynthesis